MNEPKPPEPNEEQTTILNLKHFAPRSPEKAAAETPSDESPTLIIRRAAEATAAQESQPLVAPKGSGLPAKEMLGVMAYCYSKKVFRSEDIERKMLKDPEFRKAVGDEVPSAQAIRRFRRHNREAILATLGKFFRWWRSRPIPAAQLPDGVAPRPGGAGGDTQHYVKTEAKDTLDQAAWVDNMSKED